MSLGDSWLGFMARLMSIGNFDQKRRALAGCRASALRSPTRRTAEQHVEEFVSTVFPADDRDEDVEGIVEQFAGFQQMRGEVNQRAMQRLLKEVHGELKDVSEGNEDQRRRVREELLPRRNGQKENTRGEEDHRRHLTMLTMTN